MTNREGEKRMIKSMTAYGRSEFELESGQFVAEIKSFNNRYRDVILRMPRTLQTIENEIRSQISSRIRRGRVEVFIQMKKNGGEDGYDLDLNLPLVRSYFRIFKQLNEEFGLDEKIRPDYLCQMKDVILFKPEDVNIDEALAGIQEALGRALDSFEVMRIQEGKAIEADFLHRLTLIGEYLDEIEGRAPAMVEEHRRKLRDKIKKLSQDTELDESRLIQEVAIFAERCDITEEIVRVRSHLEQFRNYMSMDDAIGRRLDFLIQEMNREVNTIGSKTFDSSTSTSVVEIKAELEKLREQVQNVE
jgi:uncharacterized protein (TIGR00255 family)